METASRRSAIRAARGDGHPCSLALACGRRMLIPRANGGGNIMALSGVAATPATEGSVGHWRSVFFLLRRGLGGEPETGGGGERWRSTKRRLP